jgi:hypothetical protein
MGVSMASTCGLPDMGRMWAELAGEHSRRPWVEVLARGIGFSLPFAGKYRPFVKLNHSFKTL